MNDIQEVKDVLEKYSQKTINEKDIGDISYNFFLQGKKAIEALKYMDIEDFYFIQKCVAGIISKIGYSRCTFFLGFLNELYSKVCSLQIQNTPVHKGLILYIEGVLYHYLNDQELATRFITLSIIDDIIHQDATWARNSDAFRFLATNFYDEVAAEHIITSLDKRIKEHQRRGDIYFPEDILNYDDHIEVIPGDSNNLFQINRVQYELLYKEFMHSIKLKKKYQLKKKTLEDLTKHLFSSVIGLQLISKDILTASSELDVVYRIIKHDNPLYEMFGHYLIIECKNTKGNVNVRIIRDFVGKLQSLSVTGGIIVSRNGITKAKNNDKLNAEFEISKAYHRHGITIVVLNKDDLNLIHNGHNLISILTKNYEKTRFDLKYD